MPPRRTSPNSTRTTGSTGRCGSSTSSGSAALCAATSASRSSTTRRSRDRSPTHSRSRLNWSCSPSCSRFPLQSRLGIISALREGRAVDHVARIISVVGVSIPGFWLGLMLIAWGAVKLGWFPAGGYVPWRAGAFDASALAGAACDRAWPLLRGDHQPHDAILGRRRADGRSCPRLARHGHPAAAASWSMC